MSAQDPYVYPGTNVLKNKFGILDQEQLATREQFYSNKTLSEMRRSSVTGAFDFDHYRDVHRRLFERVYDWAGEIRTIDLWKTEVILKGDSVLYSDTPDIERDADRALAELRSTKWTDLTARSEAGQFVGTIAELWRAHPFRDGNTRTLLAFVDQFTRERNLALDQTVLSRSASETRDALVLANDGQLAPLAALIAEARRSELQRVHPELGRISSEAVEMIRQLGHPRIIRPEVGAEVRGQVLTTTYDQVLIQRDNHVATVPLGSFADRPENNQRVTVRVLGPDELPSRSAIRQESAQAFEVRALIPPRRQASLPTLQPTAIEAHLGRNSHVRHARSELEQAAAKVFRQPDRAVNAVAQHRGPDHHLPEPPRDDELHGRRTRMGEDKARKAARAALPAFEGAARALQAATAAALAELKAQADRQAQRDQIAVPAPSAELTAALTARTPREIAADPILMAEVHTIQAAVYERFGRPGAATLAKGDPVAAAELLPDPRALDEVRAVLQPLRDSVLAEQELAQARTQQHNLSQEGPSIGYGR